MLRLLGSFCSRGPRTVEYEQSGASWVLGTSDSGYKMAPNPSDHLSSYQARPLSLNLSKIIFLSTSTIIVIMKWLFALVPLVAAAPALPSYEAGDAPDPGQVDLQMLLHGPRPR